MAVIDILTKGSLIPYVNCQQITLSPNTDNPGTFTSVKLNLEILQNKKQLLKSNWLNDLGANGASLLSALTIQIVPFFKKNNVLKLRAARGIEIDGGYNDLVLGNSTQVPSVYLAQQFLGDGWLPKWRQSAGLTAANWHPGLFSSPFLGHLIGALSIAQREPIRFGIRPLRVSIASVAGTISNASDIVEGGLSGTVKQETRHGIEYYVIPFERTISWPNASFHSTLTGENNLGFLFYSYLDVPYFFNSMTDIDIDSSLYENYFESMIVEGPINTEIVVLDGEIVKQREVFRLPNNKIWQGPAHLHINGVNPGPAGYSGTGGYGHNKGWMAGATHAPNMPRLALELTPNNMVLDYRETSGTDWDPDMDNVLGLGKKTEIHSISPDTIKYTEQLLSPFQKETRKYLRKLDTSPTNAGGHVLYDNDDEYSKLYITRDKDNSARGLFMIDFKRLLKNNSHLFPLLKTPGLEQDILSNYSKLLELKVYRDRVKKKPLGRVYEKYVNDTFYEEPSMLVGTVSDTAGWAGSVNSTGNLTEISLNIDTSVRTFTFSDPDVGKEVAGYYRYRIELSFIDGTYQFLVNKMNTIIQLNRDLNKLHDLQLSSFELPPILALVPHTGADSKTDPTARAAATYLKARFLPYWNSNTNSFEDAFVNYLTSSAGQQIWAPILVRIVNNSITLIETIKYFFVNYSPDGEETYWEKYSVFDGQGTSSITKEAAASLLTGIFMAEPGQTGEEHTHIAGPKKIEWAIRVIGTIIQKLEDLTGITKVNKTGSELADSTTPDGYQLQNIPNVVVSPSKSMIEEDYTFDHPSEIFKAISNENVYIDYLSPGYPVAQAGRKLKILKAAQYKRRCVLETTKYTDMITNANDFDTVSFETSTGTELATFDDNFHTTGYSFLSPSVVEVSSPSSHGNIVITYVSDLPVWAQPGATYVAPGVLAPAETEQNPEPTTFGYYPDGTYRYYYFAFKPGINLAAGGGAFVHSLHDNYEAHDLYEELFLNMLTYSMNKEGYDDADTMVPLMNPQWDPGGLTRRETYKKLFEEVGLTIHNKEKYVSFFNSPHKWGPAGAQSLTPTDIPARSDPRFNELFLPPSGLGPEHYSDGTTATNKYYEKFLLDEKYSYIKSPIVATYGEHLKPGGATPNLFKALYHLNSPAALPGATFTSPYKPIFTSAATVVASDGTTVNSAADSAHSWFLFFHLNLTAKIQVFNAFAEQGPLKNDESRWSLLTGDQITNMINSAGSSTLFCKISFYDENLVKGMNIPILDRYFLIEK